jgi:hypothetical protein
VSTSCALAFAKRSNSKMPITACGVLYERVPLFCGAIGILLKMILPDSGRYFCGKREWASLASLDIRWDGIGVLGSIRTQPAHRAIPQ